MIRSFRIPLLVSGVFTAAFFTGEAQAYWCSPAYTSCCYYDPCVSCTPVVTQSCYVPQTTCTTVFATTSVQRCYLEPRTAYRTVTRLEPQYTYVRRSYYDPFSCCYRSYLVPTTHYVRRAYSVPFTSYVQRCSLQPVTYCTPRCSTSYETYSPLSAPATTEEGPGATEERGSQYPPTTDEKAPKPKPVPMALRAPKRMLSKKSVPTAWLPVRRVN